MGKITLADENLEAAMGKGDVGGIKSIAETFIFMEERTNMFLDWKSSCSQSA